MWSYSQSADSLDNDVICYNISRAVMELESSGAGVKICDKSYSQINFNKVGLADKTISTVGD